MTQIHGSDVLGEVVGMIVDVLGEGVLLDVQVGPDTTFNEDLALESIEFVALAERLQRRYGERIDLSGFIAGMDLDEIMAMTVGGLVSYIEPRVQPVRV